MACLRYDSFVWKLTFRFIGTIAFMLISVLPLRAQADLSCATLNDPTALNVERTYEASSREAQEIRNAPHPAIRVEKHTLEIHSQKGEHVFRDQPPFDDQVHFQLRIVPAIGPLNAVEHQGEDEWFYAIEGEYVVQAGAERFPLTPGDSLLAPREVPHTYAHLGEGQGRMLIAYQPAGDMEALFLEMSGLVGTPSAHEVQRIFRGHGMEVVGPPLKV